MAVCSVYNSINSFDRVCVDRYDYDPEYEPATEFSQPCYSCNKVFCICNSDWSEPMYEPDGHDYRRTRLWRRISEKVSLYDAVDRELRPRLKEKLLDAGANLKEAKSRQAQAKQEVLIDQWNGTNPQSILQHVNKEVNRQRTRNEQNRMRLEEYHKATQLKELESKQLFRSLSIQEEKIIVKELTVLRRFFEDLEKWNPERTLQAVLDEDPEVLLAEHKQITVSLQKRLAEQKKLKAETYDRRNELARGVDDAKLIFEKAQDAWQDYEAKSKERRNARHLEALKSEENTRHQTALPKRRTRAEELEAKRQANTHALRLAILNHYKTVLASIDKCISLLNVQTPKEAQTSSIAGEPPCAKAKTGKAKKAKGLRLDFSMLSTLAQWGIQAPISKDDISKTNSALQTLRGKVSDEETCAKSEDLKHLTIRRDQIWSA